MTEGTTWETEGKGLAALMIGICAVLFVPFFFIAVEKAAILQTGLHAEGTVIAIKQLQGRRHPRYRSCVRNGVCMGDELTDHALIAFVDNAGRRREVYNPGIAGYLFFDVGDKVRVYYREPQSHHPWSRSRRRIRAWDHDNEVVDTFSDRHMPFLVPAGLLLIVFCGLLVATHDRRKRRREATNFLEG